MLKMIEVIGMSGISYSDAVKSVIKSLSEKGEKIHFFELIEHRGALKNGILEFQVKVKVSVEY
ncbi:MAG: dodecin family protein [Candidatus Omnitrophica bacterium]|nr:dodecin family protein [Candidatus Omnitrophota bacterium]